MLANTAVLFALSTPFAGKWVVSSPFVTSTLELAIYGKETIVITPPCLGINLDAIRGMEMEGIKVVVNYYNFAKIPSQQWQIFYEPACFSSSLGVGT